MRALSLVKYGLGAVLLMGAVTSAHADEGEGVRTLLINYAPFALLAAGCLLFLGARLRTALRAEQHEAAPDVSAHTAYKRETPQETALVDREGQASDIAAEPDPVENVFVRKLLEVSSEAILFFSDSRAALRVNPAFHRMTGYALEDVQSSGFAILVSGYHDADFLTQVLAELEAKGGWEGEIWLRRKNGEVFPSWTRFGRGAGPQETGFVVTFRDISRAKQDEETIRHQANFDPLTELPNRLLFMDRLERTLARASRAGSGFAVLQVDIDNFRAINEGLGVEAGDMALREASRRLRRYLKESDTLGRLWGDEFVILIQEVDGEDEIEKLVHDLGAELAQPFQTQGQTIFMTASIGVVLFPGGGNSAAELMAHVESATFHAKSAGRNSYRFFQDRMPSSRDERVQLETGIRRALKGDEFYLQFQPVFDLESRQLISLEALARWYEPSLGLIEPDRFIPVAEESGLITPIGEWALDQVAMVIRDLQAISGAPCGVSLNVTGRELANGGYVDAVCRAFDHHKVSPENLTVEIAETVLESGDKRVNDALLALSAKGVNLCLDKVGAGRTSLATVTRFPFNSLKIDRSVIADLDRGGVAANILPALMRMARDTDLQVVAVGVETPTQRDLVRKGGCQLVQGYLYGRPMLVAQIETQIRDGFGPLGEP